MKYYWLRDKELQNWIRVFWDGGIVNECFCLSFAWLPPSSFIARFFSISFEVLLSFKVWTVSDIFWADFSFLLSSTGSRDSTFSSSLSFWLLKISLSFVLDFDASRWLFWNLSYPLFRLLSQFSILSLPYSLHRPLLHTLLCTLLRPLPHTTMVEINTSAGTTWKFEISLGSWFLAWKHWEVK